MQLDRGQRDAIVHGERLVNVSKPFPVKLLSTQIAKNTPDLVLVTFSELICPFALEWLN